MNLNKKSLIPRSVSSQTIMKIETTNKYMITVNEYFEGNVKSLAYQSPDGKSTIGVINKGQYKFGTSSHETMFVIEGELEVLLPGEKKWKIFKKGDSFKVSANTSFEVKSDGQTSYLCKYK